MHDAVAENVKVELVDFLIHQAFYPVLMMQRSGPDNTTIEYLQYEALKEIECCRACKSAQEVIVFEQELASAHINSLQLRLRKLNLPALADLQDEFNRKLRELGILTEDNFT